MSHPRSRRAPGRSLAAVLLLGTVAGCEPRNTFVAPPPPEVTVSPPLRRSVRNSIEYTGTTKPIEAVDLRARVKGFLEKVHFKPGEEVKEGDLLFEIDPKPYQAQVDKAAAELVRDEAQLASAESEFRRSTQLYQRKVISDEEYIKARATRDSDKAAVDAAKAALTEAKVNLGYTRVTAPIDGRISRNLVDPGNLVGDGVATLLATIVKDDPIYAYMTVSEKDLLRFRQKVREGKRVDFRKVPVPLDLALASESGFPHEGRLDYADPSRPLRSTSPNRPQGIKTCPLTARSTDSGWSPPLLNGTP